MSDSSGLNDEVDFEVYEGDAPQDVLGPGENVTLGPVPDRPADGAPKAKWVDYCVALGADRVFITEDTEHHDAEVGEAVTEPGLSRDELIALADRLGG